MNRQMIAMVAAGTCLAGTLFAGDGEPALIPLRQAALPAEGRVQTAAPVTAKAVRFHVTAVNSGGEIALAEFELWNGSEQVRIGTDNATVDSSPAGYPNRGSNRVTDGIRGYIDAEGGSNTDAYKFYANGTEWMLTLTAKDSQTWTFDSYKLYAADYAPRNPRTWTLEAQLANDEWVLIDAQNFAGGSLNDWHWNADKPAGEDVSEAKQFSVAAAVPVSGTMTWSEAGLPTSGPVLLNVTGETTLTVDKTMTLESLRVRGSGNLTLNIAKDVTLTLAVKSFATESITNLFMPSKITGAGRLELTGGATGRVSLGNGVNGYGVSEVRTVDFSEFTGTFALIATEAPKSIRLMLKDFKFPETANAMTVEVQGNYAQLYMFPDTFTPKLNFIACDNTDDTSSWNDNRKCFGAIRTTKALTLTGDVGLDDASVVRIGGDGDKTFSGTVAGGKILLGGSHTQCDGHTVFFENGLQSDLSVRNNGENITNACLKKGTSKSLAFIEPYDRSGITVCGHPNNDNTSWDGKGYIHVQNPATLAAGATWTTTGILKGAEKVTVDLANRSFDKPIIACGNARSIIDNDYLQKINSPVRANLDEENGNIVLKEVCMNLPSGSAAQAQLTDEQRTRILDTAWIAGVRPDAGGNVRVTLITKGVTDTAPVLSKVSDVLAVFEGTAGTDEADTSVLKVRYDFGISGMTCTDADTVQVTVEVRASEAEPLTFAPGVTVKLLADDAELVAAEVLSVKEGCAVIRAPLKDLAGKKLTVRAVKQP